MASSCRAAAGQKTEAVEGAELARDGVGEPLFKPADGAGAHAREKSSLLPGGVQYSVYAPRTP